ncbi:uncharacterized protein BO97DRAFT_473928 [Aspergillus homomorphus CBS 101889]|uniref:VOC domain-containing protein n=1 Tax=Aspergillus homomorphus (strain CBS 101889) TaxID=1450537 RepID=A0A395HHP2_ASPHC|nr:hypothetical protein BO97DRAFT_473928 [Aspergillus homomorphus CBS 101889]RAL07023.1 hypothetical protein BO97DRAFT_473928 [Aspergillus homomorphus CBS 101889]
MTRGRRPKSLDHLVLTVRSISTPVAFYTYLGMRHEVFTSPSSPNIQRHSLIFGSQKINLHECGKEFEPKAQNVMRGSADLCFLTDTKVSEVKKVLEEARINLLEGREISVYCRAPDGNLIE